MVLSRHHLPALLAALLLLATGLLSAQDLRCAVCRKGITGQYLKLDGKIFCSRECMRGTLPKCTICSQPLDGRYLVGPDGKPYCSQACYQKTLPKCELCPAPLQEFVRIRDHYYCHEHGRNTPRCADCLLPFLKGQELPDKRRVCERCVPTLVTDQAVAQKIFQQALRDYARLTGTAIRGDLVFRPVGQEELRRVMKRPLTIDSALMTERGYYLREENTKVERNFLGQETERQTTVKSKTILVLFPCRQETMLSTLMHELTHDYLAEHYPAWQNAPLWVQEGLCQYAAVLYCQRQGLKEQVELIAQSPDTIYGNGYRYFAQTLPAKDGWVAVKRWLAAQEVQALPDSAPEAP